MKTLLIAVSAIALATPAFAQMSSSAPSPSAATTPSTTTQSAPADQAAHATTPQANVPAAPSDPKALIASEFPAYDKDSSGTLDKTEFASWMGALKAKTDTTPTPPAELTKWTDGAFVTADKDKSKTITLAELQTYLTAGA